MSSKQAYTKTFQELWGENFATPRYPDFRFLCPYCGSLEVFLGKSHPNPSLKGHCLECKNEWFEHENLVVK